MATLSNRDRIGKGLELLAEGLLPFIESRMTSAASQVGGDWVRLIAARDEAKHGKAARLSKDDPALLLRVLTEDWRVFSGELGRVEQSFASELRDVRNRHAHNDSFTGDDTYRALDTMERLLTAAGAPDQADAVRRIRLDHQRSSFEAETRRMAKAQEVPPSLAGQGLKPWRDVLAPHEDVATGNFSSSEFAADLHAVAFGNLADVGREYGDPREFFRRTFLTEGLRELLDRAIRRIGGDPNATPIVNLQTNFGGGKTHSMLALWHMFSGMPPASLPQDVQDLVGGRVLPDVRRVALVGTHLAPTGTRTTGDGTVVHTLWGELAWQLGGQTAYDMVAEADRTATNPGAALRDLIAAHSPCLILVDEWVAYARQLWGREELPAGTFDTQFTFAQTLTEVVKSVPGALLVISIPASHDPERDGNSGGTAIEVGGPNGQEALQRLQNVVRRVADQWRPASSQESFEIVRRRLFVEPSAAALSDIAAIARSFVQFYARHSGEFPREASEPAYEARIKAAYPLHPELFDRLYQDWSTLDRFQRTRGVLRLMSYVVHALWISQDAAPMILPGTVPLDVSSVSREITQYLPDSWKPIIDADIDGTGSTPVRIDSERSTFGGRMVTRRLARSIFIGSAPTLRSAHRGIERQRIWLGSAVPGDVVG
ncbi:MAG TPA: Swt1 family HEPN domain-containing protein, partial [Dermatophilaceae bacterium]|nr:Swt1 family HEPN domain-containing protein [Dermatophilaceae bacterium]